MCVSMKNKVTELASGTGRMQSMFCRRQLAAGAPHKPSDQRARNSLEVPALKPVHAGQLDALQTANSEQA